MKQLFLALFGILLTTAACRAESATQLTIDLRDGSRLVGKSLDDTLSLHTSLLGDVKLPVAGIRSIESDANKDTLHLTTTNGDTLAVQFVTSTLRVQTGFGRTDLPVTLIRSLRVSAAGRAGRLPSGLVALWSGDGDANDSLGANNGTLVGNATFADGKLGQAFSLDGTGSYVKIPRTPKLNLTDQITISFWMKADPDNTMNTQCEGLVTSDFYVIEIDNGPNGGGWGVNFAVSTTANPGGESRTTSASFSHVSQANNGAAAVTPGQWHHIAGTYDGTKLQLYIDGRPWGNPMPEIGAIIPMLPNSFVAIGSEDGRTTCPYCVANR